jgi:hypothetical protein
MIRQVLSLFEENLIEKEYTSREEYNRMLIITMLRKWEQQYQQIMQVNYLHQSPLSDISYILTNQHYKLISAWMTT